MTSNNIALNSYLCLCVVVLLHVIFKTHRLHNINLPLSLGMRSYLEVSSDETDAAETFPKVLLLEIFEKVSQMLVQTFSANTQGALLLCIFDVGLKNVGFM